MNLELHQTSSLELTGYRFWVQSHLYSTGSNCILKVNPLIVFTLPVSLPGIINTSLSTRFTVPPNGLVIYCGTIVTDEGKEKKVNIDFEPFKPINTSLYLCDNKVSY